MHFAPTEDQLLFQEAVRDALSQACPPEAVRVAGRPGVPGLWATLGEVGVLGAMIPEAHDGLGLACTELCGMFQEAGFAAVPEPLIETWVAASLLVGTDLGASWLPRVAAGDAALSVSLDGGPALHADRAGLIVLVRHGQAVAVEPAQATLTPRPVADPTRRLFDVCATAGRETSLKESPAALGLARDRGALAAAAHLLGLARWMLDTTVAYAKVREQFKRPIGSFQAVKHMLADSLLQLDFLAPALHAAAWSLDHEPDRAGARVAAAKLRANRAAEIVGRTALQVHGAIGYSEEHDLHLWLKRTWALQRTWGTDPELRARLAPELLTLPEST